MAEDCMDQAAVLARLPEKPCVTRRLDIHGAEPGAPRSGPLALYGADMPQLEAMIQAEPGLGERLDPALPICGAQVVWAAREEMARTVEDVLARRTRALFLDARAAARMAPRAARLLAAELGRDSAWEEQQVAAFLQTARGYLVDPGPLAPHPTV
jgi:glycerol-3-phosphate dehydrogenase